MGRCSLLPIWRVRHQQSDVLACRVRTVARGESGAERGSTVQTQVIWSQYCWPDTDRGAGTETSASLPSALPTQLCRVLMTHVSFVKTLNKIPTNFCRLVSDCSSKQVFFSSREALEPNSRALWLRLWLSSIQFAYIASVTIKHSLGPLQKHRAWPVQPVHGYFQTKATQTHPIIK